MTGNHRSRTRVGLAALAAALFSTALAWTVVPSAKAESGRRLCVYVEGYDSKVDVTKKDGTTMQLAAKKYIALDYKKDGGCPWIDHTFEALGPMPAHQPVRKIDCEDWYGTIDADGNYLGGDRTIDLTGRPDPCPKMANDTIYQFYVLTEYYPAADPSNIEERDLLPKPGDFVVVRDKLVSVYQGH